MEIFSYKPTSFILLLFLLFLFLFLLTAATVATADLNSQELDAALFALRSSGYTLFPNAITTSDLQLRLLSSQNSSSFTLFAPTDCLLFSLDLLSSSRVYTFSLLLHASPNFLSMSDLFSLPRRAYIETLLPNRQLFVENTLVSHNGTVLLSVSVDGVRVSVPDLFIGSNIAVHGLDGILLARYGSGVSHDVSGFAEAPKSLCERETCISPASPAILPPMGSGATEMVTGDTGIKKDGGSDHDGDRGTTKGSGHGTFSRFKRLFTP